jgi:hypothetical protein
MTARISPGAWRNTIHVVTLIRAATEFFNVEAKPDQTLMPSIADETLHNCVRRALANDNSQRYPCTATSGSTAAGTLHACVEQSCNLFWHSFWRMSRPSLNFGGGPVVIMLRSRVHSDGWH